jgi:hypothetical protein
MMTAYGNPYKALFLELLAHHWTPIGTPMNLHATLTNIPLPRVRQINEVMIWL